MAMALALPQLLRAQGQQGSGSPYSAHGFGDLTGIGQVTLAGLGGLSVTVADPYSVARANPATYPRLAHTVFEMGATTRWVNMTLGENTGQGRSTKILGFSLGVPFGRGRWGMALGLQPYTSVAYQMDDKVATSEGTIRYQYSGTGGLNRAFVGIGRVLWNRSDTTGKAAMLTAGANFEFLFGTVEANRKAFYPSGSGHYNSSVNSSLVLRAPTGTIGLMHTADLVSPARAKARLARQQAAALQKDRRVQMEWLNAGKDSADRKPMRMPKRRTDGWRWRAGLGIDLPLEFMAQHSQLATTFRLNGSIETTIDTASIIESAAGSLSVPVGLAAGIGIQNPRWSIGVEWHQRDWGNTRTDIVGYALRSEMRAASAYILGASYRPAGDAGGSLLRRTIYRAGVRYAEDPIVVRSQGITQLGMSFGLSVPIAGTTTRSRINLAVEHGQRGTDAEGLLSERYTSLHFGITITPDLREPWFRKKRIE